MVTGDAAYDTAQRAPKLAAPLATFHALDDSGPDRRVLLIGAQAWPLPIPLVRERRCAGVSRPSRASRRS